MTLVRSETSAGVATLTLDSPANRNALSTALIDELVAGARRGGRRRRGPGDRAEPHRPGLLLRRGPEGDRGRVRQRRRVPAGRMGDVLAAIWESPEAGRGAGRPGRRGPAGSGLIAAADIAVCADEATFAFTEVRIGVIPAVISATVLPRLRPAPPPSLPDRGHLRRGTGGRDRAGHAAVPADELDAAVDALLRLAGPRGAAAPWPARRSCCAGRPAADPRRAGRADPRSRSATSSPTEGREGVAAFAERSATRLGAAWHHS